MTGRKIKLNSLKGLESTTLKIGEEGTLISGVSGGDTKNAYLIGWKRDIRKGSCFVRNNCCVERENFDFVGN